VGLECSVIMFWKINSHYCASLQAPLGVEGVFQQGRLPRRVEREGLYRQTERLRVMKGGKLLWSLLT
jgi:hypothetical protein